MIKLNFIITFFRLILEQIIILFKEDSFLILIVKLFISVIFTIFLYYLYNYYKKDYKYPTGYAIKTFSNFCSTLVIIIVYYSIFIIGFLSIRFYNTNKVLNLYIMFEHLFQVIKETSIINFFITTYLIINFILLLKYMQYILSLFLSFHKHKLYYFTFIREDFFEKIFWFISRNLTIDSLLHFFINQNIAYILYFFDLIKIDEKRFNQNPLLKTIYSEKIYRSLPPYALIITTFIRNKSFILHYYILFIVFIYDMFYNNYILENVFKIMPYIFIYEIIVRYSKGFLVKKREYDTFLAYYLYATCFENNKYYVILGDRTWTKKEIEHILFEYAFNNFRDKEIVKLIFTPTKYDPFSLYNTSYYQFSENLHKFLRKNNIAIFVFFIALILYS